MSDLPYDQDAATPEVPEPTGDEDLDPAEVEWPMPADDPDAEPDHPDHTPLEPGEDLGGD